MLMSSVSAQQATLGNKQAMLSAELASASAEQARAATRITAIAFVYTLIYVPLTFVTGVFGTNIRLGSEEPKGFIWYAPLIAFWVTMAVTAALWYIANWVVTLPREERQKREQDVEGGQSGSKAKAE